jgi:hypothetical protein
MVRHHAIRQDFEHPKVRMAAHEIDKRLPRLVIENKLPIHNAGRDMISRLSLGGINDEFGLGHGEEGNRDVQEGKEILY